MSYDDGRRSNRKNERALKTAVLVLGMHRSGTSSIAGALIRLGGAAPLNLMPPNEANPKGHWESSVVMQLNEEILAAGGSRWQDWHEFDPERIDAAPAASLHERAKITLAQEFGNARLAIIKDPRMCRLLRIWSPVFREAQWSARALLPLRSPLEVALSLHRRDGIPLSHGCLIWLRHVLDAESETRGTPRAVVDWKEFLNDPRRTLERVGDQLDVTWPVWSDDALSEIDEFVSTDLRRERASDDDLRVHPAVSDLVRNAYAAILDLVDDPASVIVRKRLDDIRTRFEEAAAIFAPAMLDADEQGRRIRSQAAAEQQELANQLATTRDEYASNLAALRGEQKKRSDCDKIISELEHERASLNDNLVHLREQRKDLHRALAERSAAIQVIERQGLELHALLEKYREEAIQHREAEAVQRNHTRALQHAREDVLRELEASKHAREDVLRELATSKHAREDVLRELAASKRNDLDEMLPRKLTGWRWILPGRRKKLRRLIREYRLIAASPLFDSQWYLAKNPDVAVRREDPALHYLLHGGLEGRSPGPHFDGGAYLEVNPDVASSRSNPLLHYVRQGHKENRPITCVGDGQSERDLDTLSLT
jgi:hypothetical protein